MTVEQLEGESRATFDAGAERVLVNDSHGDMANLLFDQLDSRVEVLSGNLKPRSMVAGVEQKFAKAASAPESSCPKQTAPPRSCKSTVDTRNQLDHEPALSTVASGI